jgi:hypothetical protein
MKKRAAHAPFPPTFFFFSPSKNQRGNPSVSGWTLLLSCVGAFAAPKRSLTPQHDTGVVLPLLFTAVTRAGFSMNTKEWKVAWLTRFLWEGF